MAIATGTALAIAAAGSIGGNIASAKMKSNAANKASKAQQQGMAESSRYMQQGLGQLSQLYAPYVNAGAASMGTLGRLVIPGAGAKYASQGAPNAMPQAPNPNQSMPRPGGMYGGPQGAPIGFGQPQGGGYGGTFGQMGPPMMDPRMGPPTTGQMMAPPRMGMMPWEQQGRQMPQGPPQGFTY